MQVAQTTQSPMSPTIPDINSQVFPEISSYSYGCGANFRTNTAAQLHCAVTEKRFHCPNRFLEDYVSPGPFVDSAVPNTGVNAAVRSGGPHNRSGHGSTIRLINPDKCGGKANKTSPEQMCGGLETPVSLGKFCQQVVEWSTGPCCCCERLSACSM